MEEALRRQQESLERRESARAEASGRGAARAPAPASGFDEAPPFDEPMVALDEADAAGVGVSGAGATASGQQASISRSTHSGRTRQRAAWRQSCTSTMPQAPSSRWR